MNTVFAIGWLMGLLSGIMAMHVVFTARFQAFQEKGQAALDTVQKALAAVEESVEPLIQDNTRLMAENASIRSLAVNHLQLPLATAHTLSHTLRMVLDADTVQVDDQSMTATIQIVVRGCKLSDDSVKAIIRQYIPAGRSYTLNRP